MSEFFKRNGDGTEVSAPARVDADGNQTVKPTMTSGGNLAVSTAAAGASWVILSADKACSQLTISNDTGVTLEFRQVPDSITFPIFDGTYYTIYGITNANQIQIRRKDVSNTQVTVSARWEA